MIPDRLDHIAIGVRDLDVSVEWYTRVLGLEKFTQPEWGGVPVMMMSANNSGLALFEAEPNIRDPQRNLPHIAFVVSKKGYESYKEHFSGEGIVFKEEDHVTSLSLFVRDPDNYPIEITTYLS